MRMLLCTGCLVVIALAGSGCSANSGPPRLAVYGTVEYKSKPLANATISLVPDAGHSGPAANGTIANGEFRIPAGEGPTAGPHLVLINVIASPTGKGSQAGTQPQTLPRNHWEMKVQISKEEPTLDLVLEDK